MAPAFEFAANTGMRRGEVLGVRWRDIDLDAGRVAVRQALVSVAYKVSISDVKTGTSRRTIDIEADLVQVLRDWWKVRTEERDGVEPAIDDLVFVKADGASPHPDVFSQLFDRTVAKIDVPDISLHDLRHTHVTLLLKSGVPIKVVSERLGHANVAFTMNVYQHVLPGMQAAAAETFSLLLRNERNKVKAADEELEAEDAGDDEDDAALAATVTRRRFAAVILLGVVGYAMSILFVVQGAPDLALTQFGVETLFVVVFLLVLRRLPARFEERDTRLGRLVRLGVSGAVGTFVVLMAVAAAGSRTAERVSRQMAEQAYPEGHGRNVVNVILVDIRGLDTLGEITVLVAAALVLSVYLLFAGHNQPGGGFIGGLVAAAAIALRYIAGGLDDTLEAIPVRPWLFPSIGLALAAATAIWPLFAGEAPLDQRAFEWTVPLLGDIKVTTATVFDTGVYLIVVGLVLMIFEGLGDDTELTDEPVESVEEGGR